MVFNRPSVLDLRPSELASYVEETREIVFWQREYDEAMQVERLTSAMIECRASAVQCGIEGNPIGANTNRRHADLLARQVAELSSNAS